MRRILALLLIPAMVYSADVPLATYITGRPNATTPPGPTDKLVVIQGGAVKLIKPADLGAGGGTSATVAVGSVTTGAAGSSAAVTNAGTSSAAVFNFTIPRGATGLQGTAGATGSAGPNQVTGSTATTFASGSILCSTGTIIRVCTSTDLTNLTGVVPTALSALTADSTHRLVTDTEKTGWNDKYTQAQSGARFPTYGQYSSGNLVRGVAPPGNGSTYLREMINGTCPDPQPEGEWCVEQGGSGGVSPIAKTCTGTDKISGYNDTTGVFTCTGDQTGAGGSGITSLGGLVATTQTFAKADDTNVTLAIGSSTSTHTFTLGWTGTLADGRIASAATWNAKASLLSPSFTTPTLGVASATSLGITGTAGAGYIDYAAQSSNPASPGAGVLRTHAATVQGFTRMEQDNEAATNVVLGRDNVQIAKNTSGGTINKGEWVYVTGSTGNVPNVAKARANSATTLPVLGVALDTISNNAFGQVMTKGIISGSGIDTSTFTAGNALYLSTATAGTAVNTRPSGTSAAYVQRVGTVLSSGVAGSVDVVVAPFVGNMETGTTAATFAGNAFTGTTFNSTTIPTSKTLVVTTDKLSVHAATTSSELAGVISDETGSGALVFGTNPTIGGGVYSQTTASANTITIDTSSYAGATLTASGATTLTITNVVAGKYFDFKISSSGGGAITIATLTPTWVTGTPASITVGKASWFVCKGTGTNTADCAAIKENF